MTLCSSLSPTSERGYCRRAARVQIATCFSSIWCNRPGYDIGYVETGPIDLAREGRQKGGLGDAGEVYTGHPAVFLIIINL